MAPNTLLSLLVRFTLCGITWSASTNSLWEQQSTVLKVCAKGYFLSELNHCLPCNCKGHSDTCEDITGLCTHCQHHSTGDFCERCQDGFLPETTADGRHICRPCACPVASPSNNFALHCDKRGSTLRCQCQEGYAGHYCERCAPGYYGNPVAVGDSCKKCDCNGNSDPNLIFNECHNVTGQCLSCWGNTAGTNCERCAPGFYGDAINSKNCRECQCDKCGTASCDDWTGICHCKPGVTGTLCDVCEEGYSGFESCMGCRRCECAAASLHPTCDPHTQSCQCQPGVKGRYCERCQLGHWDYGPLGCKQCDCAGGPCDAHTGECLPETISSNINVCNISCDECIWYLIGDIRLSNKTLDELRVSMANISTGAAANDRIKYYNYTALRLQAQLLGWRNKSVEMRKQTGDLEEGVRDLREDVEYLGDKEDTITSMGRYLVDDTIWSFTLAEALVTNLTALNVIIEEMVRDWDLYSVQQDVDPEVIKQKMTEAGNMLSRMKKLDFSPSDPIATDELTKADELLKNVRQMEKILISTQAQLSPAQNLLERYNTKLSSAQELLQNAISTVHEAEEKNKVNLVKLQKNEVHQLKLIKNTEAVNDTILIGEEIITDTENMVSELDTMVKNVTEYHAAIDGATNPLKEKMENLSLADSDLVQRASDYAQELMRSADELESRLKGSNTNGFVQKAIDASNVYENIVKYVEEANTSASMTIQLSERAEEAISGISTQMNYKKKESDNVFNDAVALRSDQIEVETNLDDNVKYIEETKEALDDVRQKLLMVEEEINTFQKGRTTERLKFAKEVAESTLNRSAEVLKNVNPIADAVEEWSTNMKNNEYSTAAYDQAVVSAGVAVNDLTEIVPKLLEKLRVVEDKKPANNISTNIMRVRELIAQARSVAKKVQVSMKFNGQSSVEVHPPQNVEELKTITSLNLYIRVDPKNDPIQDQLVFYLGHKNGIKDYMGLAIKNDFLVYVYNLGGEDVEIALNSKPVSRWAPSFNLVRVERLGRHGKVFLTVPGQSTTAEQKFIQKGEAPGTESLFDLDPRNTVFLVGGAPADFKLPASLNLLPFVGCIEMASLNDEVISLYHFKQTHKMDVNAAPPCPRYKHAFSQSQVANFLFDGTGYGLVSNIERRRKFGIVTRFDIEVRTEANNGILFLMVNGSDYFVLELRSGFLHLMYNFGFSNGPTVMDDQLPKRPINDALYHEVSVIYHQYKKIILLVDRTHVKTLENEKKMLPFSDIYIGGAPSSILMSRPEFSSMVGLRGCVKGFQFQKLDFNLLEEPGTIGISNGCPAEFFMSRKAYFSGQSFLQSSAKISPFDAFEGGLNFRSLLPNGLMFYHRDEVDEFTIALENGAIVLTCKGTRVKSHKKNYADGRTHFLVTMINKQKYQLIIDDKDKQEKNRPASSLPRSTPATTNDFYFGGSPSSGLRNFTGCISNAYISRQDRDIEPEDFQKYTDKVQVVLQDCPVQRAPAGLQLKLSRSLQSPAHKGFAEREIVPCYLSQRPRATPHAYHYGGTADSRQEYTNIPLSFSDRSHFSLSLKTESPSGLILYMSDKEEHNHMALYLSRGKLVYSFNVGKHKIKIESRENLSDGSWHNVIFTRDGGSGRLITDGFKVLEQHAPDMNASWHISSPLYVGGVPPGRAQRNIEMESVFSFFGCVRDLQVNGQLLLPAANSYGVTPCYEGLSEAGTYFSAQGGYAVLDDSFGLGLKFELVMEVRPRVATGLLLHTYISQRDHFSIYMDQGEVVVLVNDGAGEFSTRVSPRQSVCDGSWHRITVIRDARVVQLDIDSDGNRVVGPVHSKSEGARAPVFIGGAPASLLPQGLATDQPYAGCMRNVALNRSPVNFGAAALVSGAVSVGSCPAA